MTIYLFLFGVLLSTGLFFLAADLLHLPTLATQKAMLSAGKQAKSKPKTTDALPVSYTHLERWIPPAARCCSRKKVVIR